GVAFAVYPDSLPMKLDGVGEDARMVRHDALARQRLTNIGMVVRDISATASEYVDLLGLGMTPTRAVDLPAPGTQAIRHKARIAYLRQRGVTIKLVEAEDGPLRALTTTVKNRAHHIGFEVGEHFGAILSRLEAAGGTILAGRRDCGYVLGDFTPQLGIPIEVSGVPSACSLRGCRRPRSNCPRRGPRCASPGPDARGFRPLR